MIPPRLILAPVDFSECGRVALTFAARLAEQCSAKLHVLHAQSPLLEAAARSRGIDLACQAQAELRRFMDSVFPRASDLVCYSVTSAPAAEAICGAASALSVDVIVMGPHGGSPFERAFLGSTTQAVLLRSTTDVVVVPPSWTVPAGETPGLSGLGPVVVGVRDLATALQQVRTADALAALLGTHVEVLHVLSGSATGDTAHGPVAGMEAMLAAIPPQRSGFASTAHVLNGEPAQAILDWLAIPERARSVLMLDRTHRRGKPALGRTTRVLLSHCQVPVFWRP